MTDDQTIRIPRSTVLRALAGPRAWLVPVSERVALDVLALPGGRTVAVLLLDGEPLGVIEGAEA